MGEVKQGIGSEFVSPGVVWRKHGPGDWLRIRRLMLPGEKDYDGGVPGVSVQPGYSSRGKFRASRGPSVFVPAGSREAFARHMRLSCREPERLAKETPND